MSEQFEYQDRHVELDKKNQFRLGEGKISAYGSVFLGSLSLLAVFAYLFPSYLTTTELRQAYDAVFLQKILKYGMYFSLFLGLLTFLLGRYRIMGSVGIGLTCIAFLLGGYTIPVGPVEPIPLSLGVDWLIITLLGSVFIFMALEKLFPKYKEQIILRKEWELDLFYFILNHLAISAVILYGNYHVSHFSWAVSPDLQHFIQSTPVAVQIMFVFLAADFVLYWEHRFFHEVRSLWRIHAVHHSVENLDWLAGSRGHFLQMFSERSLVMIPLYLLGVSSEALNFYVIFAALQAIIIHCNLGFSFGFLKYIFVTPQFHHWHHSSQEPAIDTNYSAHTVLFDRLFNTYHLPGDKWPAHYGTTVKLPQTFIGQTLYPLRAFKRKKPKS